CLLDDEHAQWHCHEGAACWRRGHNDCFGPVPSLRYRRRRDERLLDEQRRYGHESTRLWRQPYDHCLWSGVSAGDYRGRDKRLLDKQRWWHGDEVVEVTQGSR